jgi:hypothetical protein
VEGGAIVEGGPERKETDREESGAIVEGELEWKVGPEWKVS